PSMANGSAMQRSSSSSRSCASECGPWKRAEPQAADARRLRCGARLPIQNQAGNINHMEIDIKGILERLPHRYPMLLIDRVVEHVPGKSIVALKNVSINEPFFTGHFPHHPVMPGVLILEAMAQAAALFSFSDETGLKSDDSQTVYYFVGIDGARFRRPVVPGDQLRVEVVAERLSRTICKYQGQALVDGQLVAEAKLMCAIRTLEA